MGASGAAASALVSGLGSAGRCRISALAGIGQGAARCLGSVGVAREDGADAFSVLLVGDGGKIRLIGS